MIGLEEAKVIIHGADPDLDSERYSEIDASAVFEKGWLHLGEDYYFNENRKKVAGPSGGGTIRIVVFLGAKECTGRMDIDWPYNICHEMGR